MIKRIIALIIFSTVLIQPNSLLADRNRGMEGMFGGAMGGALLGGLAGGGRGAGIGAATGAMVGLMAGSAADERRNRDRYYDDSDEYYDERPAVYQQQSVRRPQRDPHFYDANLRREVFYNYDTQGNEQYYYLHRGRTIMLPNYQR